MTSRSRLTFYQSPYQQWHFSTVTDWEVYSLPLGAQFQTICAPGIGSNNHWLRALFEVRMVYDRVQKKDMRMYVVPNINGVSASKTFDSLEDALHDDSVIVWADDLKQASGKVAIVGSRDYPHKQHVIDYVNALPLDTVIVSGGARGVDTWAVETATARGMKVMVYPADWDTYGKSAGFRRNADIVKAADNVVAFHHNNSKGTRHTIGLARKAGKLEAIYNAS